MESALNQVDWVLAVDGLYYGLNLISFDDSKNTLFDLSQQVSKILFRLYKVQNHNFAQ